MRISLRKKQAGEIEFGLIFGSLAIMALVAARFLPLTDIMPSCLFKSSTGLPCPTCGTTRSLASLADGDLRGALLMNPVFALGIIGALLWLIYDSIMVLFSATRVALSLTPPESNGLRAAAFAVLLLNWCYLGLTQ